MDFGELQPEAKLRSSIAPFQQVFFGMVARLRRYSSLFLACFLVFVFLVLFIFTGNLQKTMCFTTIPRVEMYYVLFGFP